MKQLRSSTTSELAGPLNRVVAIVSAELLLRRRDNRLPILIAIAAGLCVLLTPPETAPYAVLTLGGLRPHMSASTRLLVAGIVLEFLLTLPLILTLGIGHARDRRLGTEAIISTCPLARSTIIAGRMLSNTILVVGLSVLFLVLISLTVAMRSNQAPGVSAIVGFLLCTIPSALLSLTIGAALDRWLGTNLLLKTAAAFAILALLMSFAAAGLFDVFGLQLLKANWPTSISSASFAIGIVSAPPGTGFSWDIGTIPFAFFCRQGALVLASIVGAAAIASLGAFQQNDPPPPLETYPEQHSPTLQVQRRFTRLKPRRINSAQAALVLVRRWFTRSTWSLTLAAAALLLSLLYPHALNAGPVAALLLPLLIANGGRLMSNSGRDFELSSAAFWQPAPTLFMAIVLAFVVALPVLPVLLATPALTGLQLVAGFLASSLWLTWMCVQDRPLLGISSYALLWYLEGFSTLPPGFDLLGLQGGDGVAFSITSVACVLLSFACFRADQTTGWPASFPGKAFEAAFGRSSD